MTEDTDSGLFGDSRRSFMKKGAASAGALALGAGTAAAQDNETESEGEEPAGGGGGGQVVVFGDDYEPDADFTVASSLEDGTRDELFDEIGASEEFDSPDNWDVYVINYDTGGAAPTLGHLMTEEADLSAGDSETMGTDASFRNAELDLVEASLGGGGGGMMTDEEPAANETDGVGADNETDDIGIDNETDGGNESAN